MKKYIVAGLVAGCVGIFSGCSESAVESVAVAKSVAEEKNVSLLLSSRTVKAQSLIPAASDLGDEWIEVDKEIVVEQIMKDSGSGSTAASRDQLLNSYCAEVVNSASSAKVIARSVYSNYNVEEPVALSLSWVVRGKALQPFAAADLYVLNRMYGFTEWKLDENGVAYAFPTGDIYPGVSDSMFEVKKPVAAYLAVDGGLVEVRVTSELPAKDFTTAFEQVKKTLSANLSKKISGVESKPEDIKRYWDILQKIML